MNKALVFLAGIGVGTVGALMLSPNSGERNREIIADKVDYYSTQGEQLLQQTADNVRDKVRSVNEPAAVSSDDIRAKINEARDRIAEQISKNTAQDVDSDVSDVTDDDAEKDAPAEDKKEDE